MFISFLRHNPAVVVCFARCIMIFAGVDTPVDVCCHRFFFVRVTLATVASVKEVLIACCLSAGEM